MKNIFKYIIGCIAISVATTSCQDMTEDTTLNGVDDGVAISIVANCDATRSSALDTSKSFYLSFSQEDGESYFVKVKNVSGAWVAYSTDDDTEEVEMKYFASLAAPSIVAFDCGDTTLTESEFNSTQSTYTPDGYDMLYASSDSTSGSISISSSGVITIIFNHILSQLNITLDIEDGSEATAVVIDGVYETFSFDASTNSDLVMIGEQSETTLTKVDGSNFYTLLAPQSLEGSKVTVTMESGDVYSCTITGEKVLTAAVSNTLPLVINNGDVVVGDDPTEVVAVKSLSFASWDDTTDQHLLVMN